MTIPGLFRGQAVDLVGWSGIELEVSQMEKSGHAAWGREERIQGL